jgi:HAMP domain-containing protein
MISWIRKSLIRKMAFFIVGISIVIIAGMAISSYFFTSAAILKEKKDNIRDATSSESVNISTKFSTVLAEITNISKNEYFMRAISSGDTSSIDRIITPEVSNLIANIEVVDINGIVTSSVSTEGLKEDYSKSSVFRRALSGEENISEIIEPDKDKTTFYAFSPIKNAAGAVTGVLLGEVDTEEIFNSLRSTTLHDIADLMIVNQSGFVVYSTAREDILKSLWTLSEVEKASIPADYHYEPALIKTMEYEDAKDKIQNYKKPVLFDFFCKADNEEEILSISKAGYYPIYLAVEFENENAATIAMPTIISLIITQTIVVILAMLVLIYVISKMVRPLKNIKLIVESISKGNFEQDVNIRTIDEFHDLGNTVETMALELGKLYKEQEEGLKSCKVEFIEREKELEHCNISCDIPETETKKEPVNKTTKKTKKISE